MKKHVVWLLVLIFVALSGCATTPAATVSTVAPAGSADAAATEPPTPAPTTAPAEQVTIRTSITDGEISKDQIAEFEKAHPNIKIELEVLDATKLAAELATNSAPDVIRISGAFECSSYAIRGIATDITDKLQTSPVIKMDDLLPICDVYRFDGKTIGQGPYYGLPKDWSNDYAIFYNKKCFDKAGVPVPDSTKAMTWQEVLDLAKKLTVKDGGIITQYGLAATEWGQTHPNYNFMLQYILSAGGKINSDDFSKIDYNIPAVHEFLSMWVDAVKSNVGPNAINNDQTSGGDLFLSNKAAMIINGYWYSGVIRSNADTQTHLDDFGMLPTPTAVGGTRMAACGGATGAIIYSGSKHPEEAWTLFEWFFGGKPADDRAATGWGMPIFKSKLALLPQATNFDKQVFGVLQDETKYQTQFLPVNPYLGNGGWDIFDKYAAPLYFDKSTVDEAVAGMTKDANNVVSEARSAAGN